MSQLGAAARQPLNHRASSATSPSKDIAELPPYLQRHVHLGFNQDDIAALLSSIDSSQDASSSSTTRLAHLPAELLLHIVEYVPVDHILDWRLVCRGFRDAIDGQVLYHQLRRTKLVGYLGSRHERPMDVLDDEQYEKIHLVQARFQHIEKAPEQDIKDTANRNKPIWSSKYAVFSIDDTWYAHFHNIGGAASRQGDTIEDADAQWMITLDQLELCRPEDGFGTLRWCIWLDDAVMDLDFPVEVGRLHFDVDVNLNKRRIRVAWKDMLFRFLKTERALRILLDEKRNETFTFSHSEDCLRLLRRMRLVASLNPADKLDRHTRWSLRLLHPLFGRPVNHTHATTLETTEDDALHMLLLLRRTASMTPRQLRYLSTLAADYRAMESQLRSLDDAFAEFKSYMSMPGFQMNILLPAMITNAAHVPRNPIAWPDDLRVKIETQVARWKAQKATVDSLTTMLEASNEAMGVPDDSFDEIGSDF